MKTKRNPHGQRKERRVSQKSLVAGLVLSASCSGAVSTEQELAEASKHQAKVAQVVQSLAGQDGDVVVSNPSTVLNTYSTLGLGAAKGDKTITVANAADLKDARTGAALKKGDLLMVYQAQGAQIDTSSDPKKFGSVKSLGGAGKFEFVTVDSVTGNVITIGASCGGLQNSYPNVAKTQVVRVPQFNSLKVNPGASVVAKTWDGTSGGIVAVHVLTDTRIEGSIDVTAQGFRGGKVDAVSNAIGSPKVTSLASTDPTQGAEQGESLAGSQDDYQASVGKYGRGAPANGGGGGNAHNAGGGGGAGGGDATKWSGHGVMDKTVMGGTAAWALDQAYKDNGNAFTSSSGGGRGGYSTSRVAMTGAADPTVDPPGDAKWGGNLRQDVGGLGGHPQNPAPGTELFMGGGGGAGDQDNNSGGNGGTGGGVVVLLSGSVTVPMGSGGLIQANGGDGADTGNSHGDAAGGGGGGGSIFLLTGKSIDASVQLSANGGYGGAQKRSPSDALEADGPGGGGGGGVIVYLAGGKPTVSAKGQTGGTSVASTVSKFPSNGATNGNDGISIQAPRQPTSMGMPSGYPICLPADIQVSVVPPSGMVQQGMNVDYTVTVKNAGENPALGADIVTTLPSGVDPSKVTWTCMPMGLGVTCPGGMTMGMGPLPSQADLPKDGSLTFKVTLPVPQPATQPTLDLGVSAYPPPGYADPLPGNNSATGSAPIAGVVVKQPVSDLEVSVKKSPTSPNPGDETTVTISAKNNGPDAAPKPVVVFSIPPGSVITQPPPMPGDPLATWSCTANGNSYTCTLKMDLPAGSSAPDLQVKFKTPTMPGTTGTPQVPVLIGSPSGTDPNPGNNSAVVDVGAKQPAGSADLSLTVTKTPDTNGPTMETQFSLQAKNSGPDTAQSPYITFSIPPGSVVTQEPSGTGWACTRNGTTVTCIAPAIVSGQTASPVSIKIIAPKPTTPGASPGVVAGTVDSPTTFDPNPANNVDEKPIASSTAVTPTGSDLAVKITTDKPNPKPGDEVTYTGVATNKGPDAVSNPVVVFNLPPGAVVTQPAAGDGWQCTQSGTTAMCTRDTIALGSAPPIVVKVKLPTDAPSSPAGTPSTTVVVTAPKNNDPNPGNNTAVVDTRPTQPATNADLAIEVSKDPASGGPGMDVTYKLSPSNNGPGSVANPSVTFTIPPGSTVKQAPSGTGWTCLQNGASFTCYGSADLPVGKAAPITMVLNTPAPADPSKSAGAVSAVVSSPSNSDPNPSNNQASVEVGNRTPSGSDLSIKVSRNPTGPNPSDPVVIVAEASNAGPDPVSNPVITIQLPPGAEVIDEPSGDGWTCSRDASTVLCTRDSIPQGSAPPVSVTVKMPSSGSGSTSGRSGSATAVISAPSNMDPNPANNIAGTDHYRLFGGGVSCSAQGHNGSQSPASLLGLALLIVLGLRRRSLSS